MPLLVVLLQPMSRRPWLSRGRNYTTIDRLLEVRAATACS